MPCQKLKNQRQGCAASQKFTVCYRAFALIRLHRCTKSGFKKCQRTFSLLYDFHRWHVSTHSTQRRYKEQHSRHKATKRKSIDSVSILCRHNRHKCRNNRHCVETMTCVFDKTWIGTTKFDKRHKRQIGANNQHKQQWKRRRKTWV